MYLLDYLWFLGALFVCMILSVWASAKVNRAYSKYGAIATRSGYTGYDAAVRLMTANGIRDVSIGRVKGNLTDHYDPSREIVNLSQATYSRDSIAAVSVAAHEMGHVMQKKSGYLFFKVRNALVPIVNFGSRLAFPLVLIGFIIDLSIGEVNTPIGFQIAIAGVILYGASLLFTLITLPVELNASKRAKQMLIAEGILSQDEMGGAQKVLSAAALTYVAALLTSLVYFLRFFVYVLTIFGRRGNK